MSAPLNVPPAVTVPFVTSKTRVLKHASTGVEITLQNIVCTCSLGITLNLKEISLSARNCEFNPQKFPAVIFRLRDPKGTVLLFASGKMVITGARTEHDAKVSFRRITNILKKLAYTPQIKQDFKPQNFVGTASLGFPIRLEGLALKHLSFSSYEPELFPGLIYRMLVPKVVLLIFVTGSVVITGAKTKEDILIAFDKIYSNLMEFKK